ncbi:MAG: HNH endonuclease [Stenomitos frigidus ULC029]
MPKDYISVALKRLVFDRANGCCEYCCSQAKFAIESLVIEHIIPTSRDGETSADNLALACQGCNNYKYNKTEGIDPIDAQPATLFNPRTMLWSEHFAWNEDTTLLVGLTAIGRATVNTLRLNREGVVNLRQVLRTTGQHPPV